MPCTRKASCKHSRHPGNIPSSTSGPPIKQDMGVAAGVQDTQLRALAAADPTIQNDEAAGSWTDSYDLLYVL
jgi:hypothetical protein